MKQVSFLAARRCSVHTISRATVRNIDQHLRACAKRVLQARMLTLRDQAEDSAMPHEVQQTFILADEQQRRVA